MKKLRVQGRFYFKAHQNGWLKSLSYFLYFTALFPHKRFKVAQLPKHKQQTAYKHLKRLVREGVVTKDKDYYILASKSVLDVMFKNNIKGVSAIYMDYTTNINEIHKFLLNIPLLSNFYAQKKARERKKHYCKLKQKVDLGYPIPLKELKCLKRFLKKYDNDSTKTTPQPIYSSLEKTMKLNNISKPTAVKCRRFLENKGICTFENTTIFFKKGSFEEYLFCQRYNPSLRYLKGTMFFEGAKKVNLL